MGSDVSSNAADQSKEDAHQQLAKLRKELEESGREMLKYKCLYQEATDKQLIIQEHKNEQIRDLAIQIDVLRKKLKDNLVREATKTKELDDISSTEHLLHPTDGRIIPVIFNSPSSGMKDGRMVSDCNDAATQTLLQEEPVPSYELQDSNYNTGEDTTHNIAYKPIGDANSHAPLDGWDTRLADEPADAYCPIRHKITPINSPHSVVTTHRQNHIVESKSDNDWRSALNDNYQSLEELLTVRIVIDYMKDRIASKHMDALGQMKKDWQKIEYLVRTVLIQGSSESFDIFTQALLETNQTELHNMLVQQAHANGHRTLTKPTISMMEIDQRRCAFRERMKNFMDEIPSGIYAIQYVDKNPPVMVFCDRENEAEARHFAINLFGVSEFQLCPTNSAPTLLECDLPNCKKGINCPSQTGFENDMKPRPWVGPGSPILAMTKIMWEKIQKNNNHFETLQDVEQCHKEIVENEMNGDRPFMEYWSLGCFTSDLPNTTEEVILTAVHPLNGSDESKPAPIDAINSTKDSPVVFLTQIHINDRNIVKILGYVSCGFFSVCYGLDFLLIHPHKDIKRYMCSKIKSTCSPNYVNIEPTFDTPPPFKRHVTKRGAVTGNTFGRICTTEDLYMPVRVVKRPAPTINGFTEKRICKFVDAFAVSYEQTECMAFRRFAEQGDSGGIIFDSIKQPENRGCERNAYGIVWKRMEICDEIENERSERIVCTKISRIIDFLNKESPLHLE